MSHTNVWSNAEGWGIDPAEEYVQVLRKRATGELPEMESSKALAKQIQPYVAPNASLLDVGCGAGHYLRSIRNVISVPFTYTGVDVTPLYVETARSVFAGDTNVHFHQGDIHSLPFDDNAFEVVFCCNVLLHLPSIAQPIRELCRVARKHVVIRTLIGERSFRIQDVHREDDEFSDEGLPRAFHWYNIYSNAYVSQLLKRNSKVKGFNIAADLDYDTSRLAAAASEQPKAYDVTTVIGHWQVNGYILQPWAFVHIEL